MTEADILPDYTPPIPCPELAKWLAAVGDGRWIWARNPKCKYVTLKIDTRRGAYAMEDRDGNPITLDDLLHQFGRDT